MGNYLFQERIIHGTSMLSTYKACTVDKDCYGAAGDYFAATEKTESMRCCMRIELRKKGITVASEANRNEMEVFYGWPTEYYHYVKVCKYDYAIYFENL